LFIRQIFIGLVNADTIGVVENSVSLVNNYITIFNVGVFTYGEDTASMPTITRRSMEKTPQMKF